MKTIFNLSKEEHDQLFQRKVSKTKFDEKVPGLILVKTIDSPLCFRLWKPMLAFSVEFLEKIKSIVVILFQGGDFCAVVFSRNEKLPLQHRSFHKYIIRKKQGKKQSSNDKSGHASSAGSQIRRENEKNLNVEILQWKKEWNSILRDCDLILVSIPDQNNMKMLFDDRLDKIQTIPFDCHKANYENLMFAYEKSISVKIALEDFELKEKDMTPVTPIQTGMTYFPGNEFTPVTPIDFDEINKFFTEKVRQQILESDEVVPKKNTISSIKVQKEKLKSPPPKNTSSQWSKYVYVLLILTICYFLFK